MIFNYVLKCDTLEMKGCMSVLTNAKIDLCSFVTHYFIEIVNI